MSSIQKKVRRSHHNVRPNQVDAYNEKSIREGLESGAKSVKILHPTGGYRDFSLSRIQCMGGTQGMWNIIATTLLKNSSDYEGQLKEKQNEQPVGGNTYDQPE